MNFLRSGLFSDTPSRSSSEISNEDAGPETSEEGEINDPPPSSGWSFGGLVKSLGKVSGEVLQAYKHDLSEFADGLKNETKIVAGAVKELPQTLETSAVVAQESLESVGHSLEDFGGSIWRGTSELIGSLKEAVTKVDDENIVNSKPVGSLSRELSASQVTSWKYSRYELQVNAMQRDSSTYSDEPEDEDYPAWLSTFNLAEKKSDIEGVLKDNTFMQELEARIVPLIVEYDTFWTRYFFRLHKLQQIEDARVDLVKRATSSAEEELSWDVEEEAEESRVDPNDSHIGRIPEDSGRNDPGMSEGKKTGVVRFEEASSGGASPVRVQNVESGEADHPGGAHDEESVSEGSTGSDWLVVQDDKEQGVDTPEKTASTPTTEKGSVSSVETSGPTMDADEPELEEIGDLAIDNSSRAQSSTHARQTVADKKSASEEPEDWGDWE